MLGQSDQRWVQLALDRVSRMSRNTLVDYFEGSQCQLRQFAWENRYVRQLRTRLTSVVPPGMTAMAT